MKPLQTRHGLVIREVRSYQDKRLFLNLPRTLLGSFSQWVPMLRSWEREAVMRQKAMVMKNGPHAFFLAFLDRRCVGRICVGIDSEMNRFKGVRHAHFFFFDCIENPEVGQGLLRKAEEWTRQMGMDYLKGPVSFTNGDDFRGMLTQGFDEMPTLFMMWNPPYYVDFFHDYQPYITYWSFLYDLAPPLSQENLKLIEHILAHYGKVPFEEIDRLSELDKIDRFFPVMQEVFGYTAENVDFSDRESLIDDFQELINAGNAQLSEDFRPITRNEVLQISYDLERLVDPKLTVFARYKGKRVGLIGCIPNYNPIIKQIRGSLFPMGWWTFLTQKNRMQKARGALFYVKKEHMIRGASVLMLLKIRKNLTSLGYERVEIATIDEKNTAMRKSIAFFGARPYRKYTVFGRALT